MSTIAYTSTKVPGYGSDVTVFVWTPLANGDDGAPIQMPGWADRSVQVVGTFGAAGNLKVEGSNDGQAWAALNDPQGVALDITAAKIKQVLEVTRYIRPRVSAGDGTTALTMTLVVRRG